MGAGYSPKTRLDCSSYFEVGNRRFKNYESASYGMIGFDQALALSCDTFFYRIAYALWLKEGGNSSDVNTHDPLVEMAQKFGLGKPTGVDLPGEVSGRIADRKWKKTYYDSQKDYYCKLAENPPAGTSAFLKQFSREFCVDGYKYRAGDAVNFAIGQGDTTSRHCSWQRSTRPCPTAARCTSRAWCSRGSARTARRTRSSPR